MTQNPYRSLGFSHDDFSDLEHYLAHDLGAGEYDTDFYDSVVSYQDESGVRVSVFDSNLGHRAVLNFHNGKPLIASAYRVDDHLAVVQLRRPGGEGPEGEVYNQLACNTDEAFTLPPGNPVAGSAQFMDSCELSAWALEYSLFTSVEEWREKSVVAADGGPTPENLRPEVLYSESMDRFHKDLNPRRVVPFATLAAEITAVERRTNGITDGEFYVCDVALPTGTLSVLVPTDGEEPRAGSVFVGTVFASMTTGYWQKRIAES